MSKPSIACSIVIEPQLGLDYPAQLAAARAAEHAGFAGFYRSDHYGTPFPVRDPAWTDAWTTLAGLARETDRIALGTLVSPVTFRLPGVLAATAATTQAMSGGRVTVGVGAGWDAAEHEAFGIPFPPLSVRLDQVESQLRLIRAIWDRADGPDPKPTLVVGGQGGPRSRAIALREADGYSMLRADPSRAAHVNRLLDAESHAIGRDPRSLRRSALVGCLIGADDRAYRERRRALGEVLGIGSLLDSWLDERTPFWVHGGPQELRATLVAYRDAGCDEVVLEIFDGSDLGLIEEAAEAARPIASR
jgi:alkanesulfonate monooxygenase SsuD/methylene tetrahydromethanopterin reductase-like flavin-dependent oxidoreductase (luciferase family)